MRKPHDEDPRLRMQARARLADPMRPPNFIFAVVKPRFQNGSVIQPPIRLDSRIARVGGCEIRREPNETYDEFRARVASYLPVNGLPGFAYMEPTEDLNSEAMCQGCFRGKAIIDTVEETGVFRGRFKPRLHFVSNLRLRHPKPVSEG